MNTEPLYELRVLSGEQRGASSVMQPGQTLRIGRDWSSEVVLQQAQGSAVLSFSAEDGLVLQAEQGDCTVADHALLPGGRNGLALYVPFSVGGVRMAVGKMGASQWAGLFDGNVAPQAQETVQNESTHAEEVQPPEAAPAATSSGEKWHHCHGAAGRPVSCWLEPLWSVSPFVR